MSSTIGKLFKLTTFGESHGVAIGGIIDGCPSGFKINIEHVMDLLDKRRPGKNQLSSERNESDRVEFLSGIRDGVTLGSPIGFIIRNRDARSDDYDSLKNIFRPSHADFTYERKYGIRDHRGGGRSSARETANWVVAGSIALQILNSIGISIASYVSEIGGIQVDINDLNFDLDSRYNNNVRCPVPIIAKQMEQLIQSCKLEGDTVGGQISTIISGVPVGLGEPVFNKLGSALAQSIMSINSCKGIDFGLGFLYSKTKGSDVNDQFFNTKKDKIKTVTNNSGGMLGGISNGEDIFFRTVYKPVSTIFKNQHSVNDLGENIQFTASGRHDPCVVPRVVPIIDSLTAITILDYYLLNKTTKISDL